MYRVRHQVSSKVVLDIFMAVLQVGGLILQLLCSQRSVAESFCDIAVTVQFYCNCSVAKTFRNGAQARKKIAT